MISISDDFPENRVMLKKMLDKTGSGTIEFLRLYNIDSDGTVLNVSDITLSGTPYTPVGTVVEGDSPITPDNHSELALDDGTNPHGTTKTDIGLSNVPNVDATQRSSHTGTQTAATISDFDVEVSNNISVVANTAKVSADGSVSTHSDVSLTGISTDQYLKWNGSSFEPASLPIFGTEYESFLDQTNTNFTSGTQIELRSETTTSKPSGTYFIDAFIQLEPGATGNNTNLNIRVNGVQVGLEYEDEGKDIGSDIRKAVRLKAKYVHVSPGPFNIEIWGDNDNSGTSVIHGHDIDVWRVL